MKVEGSQRAVNSLLMTFTWEKLQRIRGCVYRVGARHPRVGSAEYPEKKLSLAHAEDRFNDM